MLLFGMFISRCRIFGRIFIKQYFSSNFKIWKSILNFLPMVKVSKFPLPYIDILTSNPSIRIYMAPKVRVRSMSPSWARIVPKIYTLGWAKPDLWCLGEESWCTVSILESSLLGEGVSPSKLIANWLLIQFLIRYSYNITKS